MNELEQVKMDLMNDEPPICPRCKSEMNCDNDDADWLTMAARASCAKCGFAFWAIYTLSEVRPG